MVMEAEMIHQWQGPGSSQQQQQLRGPGADTPWPPRREPAQPTLGIPTFVFQDQEGIHFCCLSHLVCGDF